MLHWSALVDRAHSKANSVTDRLRVIVAASVGWMWHTILYGGLFIFIFSCSVPNAASQPAQSDRGTEHRTFHADSIRWPESISVPEQRRLDFVRVPSVAELTLLGAWDAGLWNAIAPNIPPVDYEFYVTRRPVRGEELVELASTSRQPLPSDVQLGSAVAVGTYVCIDDLQSLVANLGLSIISARELLHALAAGETRDNVIRRAKMLHQIARDSTMEQILDLNDVGKIGIIGLMSSEASWVVGEDGQPKLLGGHIFSRIAAGLPAVDYVGKGPTSLRPMGRLHLAIRSESLRGTPGIFRR